MVKVSNVLFVIFLIGFTASKQLQGQAATLSLKSKQKIADLINEMIPKKTREALQKEGLLEKDFTDKVYSTVIEEMTNDGLLSQAKQQQIQDKKQTPKADFNTMKEATELIEYVLSDNVTEHSEEQDKDGETGIRNKIKIAIRKPEQVKEEEYPEEPEDLPSDAQEEQIVSQPENTTNTTEDIEIEQPIESQQNKTQEQLPSQEQPEEPSQPQSPIEQQPQIQEQSNTTETVEQEDTEVELVDEPEFKPLFPKGLVKNIYNKFLNEVKESGLACKKKNCQKP